MKETKLDAEEQALEDNYEKMSSTEHKKKLMDSLQAVAKRHSQDRRYAMNGMGDHIMKRLKSILH